MDSRIVARMRATAVRTAIALFLVVAAVETASAADSCASGSASVLRTDNGIEFRLDKSYPCWRNIDGTYTVVSSSGVRVQSMTPGYSGGRNGYQIVDRIESGRNDDPTMQSLDNRQCQRMPDTRCKFVSPPSLPMTVPAERSLIKIVSDNSSSICTHPGNTRCVSTATALTVVASDRTPGCSLRFRPPSAGTTKLQHCADSLRSDIGSKLPNLDLVGAQGPWSLSYANGQILMDSGTIFGVPDANHDLVANTFIPLDALVEHKDDSPITPQVGYGAPVANAITAAIVRTLQVGSVDEKYPVVWKSIQIGLDAWGLVHAGRTYYAAGGIQHGRVLPILYAWYFLQDSALLSDMGTGKFQENGFAYYSTRTGEPLWGRYSGCIANESEVRAKKDTRWCPGNANDIRDGGHMKFGTCGTDVNTMQPTKAEQLSRGCWSMTSYQGMIAAYYGALAAARNLPGVEQAWNYPAFFDVFDKFLGPPWNGASPNYNSPYLQQFAIRYSGGGGSSVPVPSELPTPYLR